MNNSIITLSHELSMRNNKIISKESYLTSAAVNTEDFGDFLNNIDNTIINSFDNVYRIFRHGAGITKESLNYAKEGAGIISNIFKFL